MKKITREDKANIYQTGEVVLGYGRGSTPTAEEYAIALETAFMYLRDEFAILQLKHPRKCPTEEVMRIMLEGAKLGIDLIEQPSH